LLILYNINDNAFYKAHMHPKFFLNLYIWYL